MSPWPPTPLPAGSAPRTPRPAPSFSTRPSSCCWRRATRRSPRGGSRPAPSSSRSSSTTTSAPWTTSSSRSSGAGPRPTSPASSARCPATRRSAPCGSSTPTPAAPPSWSSSWPWPSTGQEIRAEIARYAERYRATQVDALRTALARRGVTEDEVPPEAALLLMTGLSQVMSLEGALGVTAGPRGHPSVRRARRRPPGRAGPGPARADRLTLPARRRPRCESAGMRVERSPADVVRLVTATAALLVLLVVEWLFGDTLVAFSTELFRGLDALPQWIVDVVVVGTRVLVVVVLGGGLVWSVVQQRWRMLGTVALAAALAVGGGRAARRAVRHGPRRRRGRGRRRRLRARERRPSPPPRASPVRSPWSPRPRPG